MFKVPKKTTVNKTEPIPDGYAIMFAPELVRLILTGQKIKTYRFGKKYDYLKVGDTVKIQNSVTREISCLAKLTQKNYTTFKDLPLDTSGHETAKNKEHQRQVLSGYYAFLGRPIADNDPFIILEFELL